MDLRREWIDEVLTEVRSKYKRKTRQNHLSDYEIKEWDEQNKVLVQFPNLEGKTKDELKEVAQEIRALGMMNQMNVFRDKQVVDVFDVEALKSQFRTEQMEKYYKVKEMEEREMVNPDLIRIQRE